jgi:succinoglycan biosynthesis transport protein ExoP
MAQAVDLHTRHAPAASSDSMDRMEGGEHSIFLSLFHAIWKRKWLLAAIVLAGTITGIATSFLLPARYTSEAVLEVNSRKWQFVDVNPIISDLPPDRNILWSATAAEVEQLASAALAWQVVQQLQLARDPEFNPQLRQDSAISPWRWISWVKERLAPFEKDQGASSWTDHKPVDAAQLGPTWRVPMTRDEIAVVREFRSHLFVRPDRLTGLIHVSFTSQSPLKAQAVVQALVNSYLSGQVGEKQRETEKAAEWLRRTLADLKSDVTSAERAVETFRSQAHLSATRGTSVIEQQVAETTSQLTTAQAEQADVTARLDQTEQLLKNPSLLQSSKDALASPVIQALRQSEAQETSYRARLMEHYGPAHPEIIQANAAIAQIHDEINAEISRMVAALRNELDVAKARTDVFRKRLADLQAATSGVNSAEARLHELEREAQASRDLYSSFLLRFKELTTQLGIERPDVHVVSAPERPILPSSPNRRLITAGALLSSFGFGVLLIMALEAYRPSVQTLEELKQTLGYKPLGIIPMFGRRSAHSHGGDAKRAEEALQGIRASLLLEEQAAKVIQITSAIPEEGKSTFALLFARVASRSGRRIVIVDLDLARPSLHRAVALPNDRGIADVLGERIPLSTAIQQDPMSKADIICAGSEPLQHPTDLLASPHARRVLDALRKSYDLVIVDCPPVLAVPDARLIARLADATVLLVQWRRTPRKMLLDAVHQLEDTGAHILGVVLARVHLKTYSRYYGQELRYAVDYTRASRAS